MPGRDGGNRSAVKDVGVQIESGAEFDVPRRELRRVVFRLDVALKLAYLEDYCSAERNIAVDFRDYCNMPYTLIATPFLWIDKIAASISESFPVKSELSWTSSKSMGA